MVHVTVETNRHAGHADILRELIDGTVGLRESSGDGAWYVAYRNRLEESAKQAQAKRR